MTSEKIKFKWDNIYVVPVSMILLMLVIGLWNISKLYGPIIMADETGFWASAAWFIGKDWSGVMSTSPYYGYGYGLLLAPIWMLSNNSVLVFRMAILFNIILHCLTFVIAISVSRKLFPKEKQIFRYIVCFSVVNYSAFVFNTQCTYVETVIVFFFWLIFWMMLKLEETKKTCYAVYLAVSSVYLLALHLRTIGVVVALCVCLLLFIVNKKINVKMLLIFGGVFVSGMLLFLWLKEDISANLYLNGANISGNDFSGQSSKVFYLFTLEGLKVFCVNVLGRIFYLGSSTFFVIYLGFGCLLVNIINGVKRKRQKEHFEALIFLMLGLTAAVAISAVFLIDGTRMDHVLYGRYSEYVIGPILLYAFFHLNLLLKQRYLFGAVVVAHALGAVAIGSYIQSFIKNAAGSYAIAGIYQLPNFLHLSESVRLTVWTSFITIVIAIVFFLVLKTKHCISRYIIVVAFCIFEGCLGISLAADQFYNFSETHKSNISLSEQIIECVGEQTVYYIVDPEEYYSAKYWAILRLKFFLPDTDVQIRSSEQIYQIPADAYILMSKMSKSQEELLYEHQILFDDDEYAFLIHRNALDYYEKIKKYSKRMDFIYLNSLEENFSISEGNRGYLLQQTGQRFFEGKYKLNLHFSNISSDLDNLGYIEVLSDKSTIELKMDLDKVVLANDGSLEVEFYSKDTFYGEVRVFVNEGVYLTIDEYSWYWYAKEYVVGKNRSEELNAIQTYCEENEINQITYITNSEDVNYDFKYLKQQMEGISIDNTACKEKKWKNDEILLLETSDTFWNEMFSIGDVLFYTNNFRLVNVGQKSEAYIRTSFNTYGYDMRLFQKRADGTLLNNGSFALEQGYYVLEIDYCNEQLLTELVVDGVYYSERKDLEIDGKNYLYLYFIVKEDNQTCGITLYNSSVNCYDVIESGYIYKILEAEPDVNEIDLELFEYLDNRVYVIWLYDIILSRRADPDGLAHWTERLNRYEMSREEIYDAFIFSDEYQALLDEQDNY